MNFIQIDKTTYIATSDTHPFPSPAKPLTCDVIFGQWADQSGKQEGLG